MIHILKIDSDAFEAVKEGLKTYEIRKNDCGFRVGDELWLELHTGEEAIVVKVTHILQGPHEGLLDGWCIMSITEDFE